MKTTVEELLAKAKAPGEDAMRLHPYYQGKIEVTPKCAVRDLSDFAIWYTPGVAEPCKAIQKDREKVYDYTNKWNTVAVVSDGTRVLGLGDIGPEAGLPVMEGKGLIFKYLGGVDVYPLVIGTKDPDKIIEWVQILQPAVGGVNLEDLAQPKCFRILDTLRAECEIPIWHDDQQGTATVITAGVINAVKLVGKRLDEVQIVLFGAGAANIRTVYVLEAAGARRENIVITDSKGVLHRDRPDRKKLEEEFKQKWEMCLTTNRRHVTGAPESAFAGADVVVAASTPGPGTIKPEWIKRMARDAIVFPCANPVPEIWPWEAKEAGARIVGTGRSDFPNQINNSLGFPGIFRGTLDVRARTITDEMCVAAARELAKIAEDKGLREDYIVPSMAEWEVFPREAVAVAKKAMEQKIARLYPNEDDLYERANSLIKRARVVTQCLMERGLIPNAPPRKP
ncbi:MAG: NADP-dependent malic enzyme [Deltaproteobacteria bacterium]|nr:NADP-dependent malic enzyme [Deltaproteobacteria bacterium]